MAYKSVMENFLLNNLASFIFSNYRFIQDEYWKRNFQEVVTPNMFNAKLWMTSGHWEHYSDDMFKIDVDKEQFGLKPMNCPGKINDKSIN